MIEIIYEDEHTIALNKRPGVVVFSDTEESLAEKVSSLYPSMKNLGEERHGAVHRLDRDTSGVVVFAKDKKTLLFLQEQFLLRKAKKKYIALVFKKVKKDEGEINIPIGRSPKKRTKQRAGQGREAVTFFRTIKRYEKHSLLEVFPQSGRKHQIRCHLAHIGHPVAGDKFYGFKDQVDPQGLQRIFLHAQSLEIETPKGKKKFKAELPEDLKEVINKLEKDVS